jgi:hypothetical protein
MSYHRILGDYLTDHLIYLSASSSFWFSLNSSYEHDFHLNKRLGTSWPTGCCIASLRPLVVPPSCPALLIAVALTLAPSIACCRHPVRRHRCRCCCQAVAAVALLHCRHRSCRHRCAAAKLPPTSHCCAAATAAAATLLPPCCCHRAVCRCRASRCRHRR